MVNPYFTGFGGADAGNTIEVELEFISNRTVGDWFIRFLTRSQFSHVRIWLGGLCFEALPRQGVIVRAARSVPAADHSIRRKVGCYAGDWLDMRRWLCEQVGKPYDWKAIFSTLMLGRNWQEEGSWFCSELAAAAFARAGMPLLNHGTVNTGGISPRDLLLSKDLRKGEL